jgi:CheY-like chemotaxis protein
MARATATILIVDDESPVRRALERVLRARGHRVLSAATPREALGYAEEHVGPIDLALIDLSLPEMDGVELSRRIARIRGGVATIVMSGHAPGGAFGACVHARFLLKPFEPKTLLAEIDALLAPLLVAQATG